MTVRQRWKHFPLHLPPRFPLPTPTNLLQAPADAPSLAGTPHRYPFSPFLPPPTPLPLCLVWPPLLPRGCEFLLTLPSLFFVFFPLSTSHRVQQPVFPFPTGVTFSHGCFTFPSCGTRLKRFAEGVRVLQPSSQQSISYHPTFSGCRIQCKRLLIGFGNLHSNNGYIIPAAVQLS